MASDLTALSALQAGITQKVTMDGTAGNLTQITFPVWCRRVTMTFYTSADAAEAGYFEMSGTDGAAKSANAFLVASGGAYTRKLVADGQAIGASGVLYLAGSSISGYTLLDLEP